MWLTHDNFHDFLAATWNSCQVTGPLMQCLMSKLKHLRMALRSWNVHIFGNLNMHIKEESTELLRIQSLIEGMGFTEELHFQELLAHRGLELSLTQ